MAAKWTKLGILGLLGATWLAVAPNPVGGQTASPQGAESDTTEAIPSQGWLPELEDFLSGELEVAKEGAFGHRLQAYGIKAHWSGYYDFDLAIPERKPWTFDQHHFAIMLAARIRRHLYPEIALEYEHGFSVFYLPYAFLDVKPRTSLLVRMGYFLVPFGTYNAESYPGFLRKTPLLPMVLKEIVPVPWSEVGVGISWEKTWSAHRQANLWLYVVNGLEQRDPDPEDELVPDDGAIRDMRRNFRDRNVGSKAVGLRLGFEPFLGLEAGLSGYHGAYTTDGLQHLSLLGADVVARWRRFYLRSEVAYTRQEREGRSPRERWGVFLLGSWKATRYLEPVVMGDWVRHGGSPYRDADRLHVGVDLYPYPVEVPSLVIKAFAVRTWFEKTEDLVTVQLSVGF
jgi:hypothetical protein